MEQFLHAFASRGFVSVSWAFLCTVFCTLAEQKTAALVISPPLDAMHSEAYAVGSYVKSTLINV